MWELMARSIPSGQSSGSSRGDERRVRGESPVSNYRGRLGFRSNRSVESSGSFRAFSRGRDPVRWSDLSRIGRGRGPIILYDRERGAGHPANVGRGRGIRLPGGGELEIERGRG